MLIYLFIKVCEKGTLKRKLLEILNFVENKEMTFKHPHHLL